MIGFGIFLTVAILTQVLSYQQLLISQRAQRDEALAEANMVADKLKSVLSYSLSATRTLAFVVENYGEPDDFDGIARNILQSNPYIDAVELTRKGTITHIYPLAGNEAAIGYDVLSDSTRNREAFKALKENKLFFAGPFHLKQGGFAVVGRLPIFRGEEFWGFSVVIINFSTLLRATGIDQTTVRPFDYQISKVNPSSGEEEFLLPGKKPKGDQFISVQVPDGLWNLYVFHKYPTTGWSAIRPIALLGLVLAITTGLFSWDLARQPEKLRRRVTRATDSMNRVNRLYKFTSQLNRIAVQVTTELDMFQQACNIAVEAGTYKMAWVGIVNKSDETIEVACSAGEGTGYVDEIVPVSLKPAGYEIPVSRLLNTNNYVYCNDIANEPLMKNWAQRALRYGFQSVILLPIRKHGEIIGAFILYSGEKDALDQGEIRLLEESVATISFVIENIEKERRRTEAEAIIQKEKILSDSIINSMPGVFYFYDRKGKFLRWNRNFETISGYSGDEIVRMHPLDFFEGEQQKLLKSKIENVFLSGQDEVIADFVTRDSRRIPYYFSGRRIVIGSDDFLIGMGWDISDRIEAENKLRDRNEEIEKLSVHLQEVREKERARIALEIHDVLGQQLTAIKMDATWIKRKSAADEQVVERISAMIALVDDTIKTVRRISSELRPGILDDLGLVAALEWQGTEFERNTGIKVTFTANVSEINLPPDVATNIFRIYQEALTNVARHAYATRVDSRFSLEDEEISLEVEDNGIGFSPEETRSRKSIGLISMKERARSFNGNLTIVSNAPHGTAILLNAPYPKTGVNV